MQDQPLNENEKGKSYKPLAPEDEKFIKRVLKHTTYSNGDILMKIETFLSKGEEMTYNDLSITLSYILDDYLLRNYKGIKNLDTIYDHINIKLIEAKLLNVLKGHSHPKEIAMDLYTIRLRSNESNKIITLLNYIKKSIDNYLKWNAFPTNEDDFLKQISNHIGKVQSYLEI